LTPSSLREGQWFFDGKDLQPDTRRCYGCSPPTSGGGLDGWVAWPNCGYARKYSTRLLKPGWSITCLPVLSPCLTVPCRPVCLHSSHQLAINGADSALLLFRVLTPQLPTAYPTQQMPIPVYFNHQSRCTLAREVERATTETEAAADVDTEAATRTRKEQEQPIRPPWSGERDHVGAGYRKRGTS
jgi:hypothetical protein